MPACSSSAAVPPVETISTPSSRNPRAKSTIPRLSETVSSARRTFTSPGLVTAAAPPSVVAIDRLLVDYDTPRRVRIDLHRSRREQPHRTRQQPVLDLVDLSLNLRDVPSIRNNVEGLLQDDRPRVDPLVDEVNGDPHHRHAVLEG